MSQDFHLSSGRKRSHAAWKLRATRSSWKDADRLAGDIMNATVEIFRDVPKVRKEKTGPTENTTQATTKQGPYRKLSEHLH